MELKPFTLFWSFLCSFFVGGGLVYYLNRTLDLFKDKSQCLKYFVQLVSVVLTRALCPIHRLKYGCVGEEEN